MANLTYANGLFNGVALQTAVNKALENAPDGHRNAFVLTASSTDGVDAVLTTQINGVWSIDAIVHVAKGEKPAGGIAVKATW